MFKVLFLNFQTATLPQKITLDNVNIITQTGYVYVEINDLEQIEEIKYKEELVRPDIKIEPKVVALNNISNEDVGLVPDKNGLFKKVSIFNDSKIIKDVLTYLKDEEIILAGFNIPFIIKVLEKNNIFLKNKQLFDVFRVIQKYYSAKKRTTIRNIPFNFKLNYLINSFIQHNQLYKNFYKEFLQNYFPDYSQYKKEQALFKAFNTLFLVLFLKEKENFNINFQLFLANSISN